MAPMMTTTANNNLSPPHIVFVDFPIGSHSATLFAVTRPLALAAPDAVFSFVSSPESIAPLARLLASAPIPNLRLVPVMEVSGCTPDEQLQSFARALPGNLRPGIEAAVAKEAGLRLSCIMSDSLLPHLGAIAREMGVPWIPVWSSGPTMLVSFFYAHECRKAFADEKARDELVSFIPSLAALRARDLPEFFFTGKLKPLISGVANEYPKAIAVVSNSFEGLEPLVDAELTSRFKNYLRVGPTHFMATQLVIPQEDQCMSWLDCQHTATVVYVSFGTFNTPSPAELVELAEGLEASGAPFLWSLKENARDGLPPGFFKRTEGKGLMVGWAPQVQVLGHPAVGAFVTHGGWNSLLESIASGVPAACRPFKWDQMMNARMVNIVYGTGIILGEGGVRKDELVRALKVLLEEEEGVKMREKARELKEQAQRAVAPGGSTAEDLKSLVNIICGRC